MNAVDKRKRVEEIRRKHRVVTRGFEKLTDDQKVKLMEVLARKAKLY